MVDADRCRRCPATTTIESHHVVPIAYGGKRDGQQILICSNCHTSVHKHIENPELRPPPNLIDLIRVGREAKRRFLAGELEARDRRPTLVVPMTPADEEALALCKRLFNTNSRAETMLVALRFAAQNARKVR